MLMAAWPNGSAGLADTKALRAGANRAQSVEALSHTLFEARARVVAGESSAGKTRSYVSGLLIGTEFAARRDEARAGTGTMAVPHLIAPHELTAPYREVAQMPGYATELIDPDQAYCAALARFMEAI